MNRRTILIGIGVGLFGLVVLAAVLFFAKIDELNSFAEVKSASHVEFSPGRAEANDSEK